MPKNAINVSANQSQGKYSFDTTSKLFVWEAGKLEGKTASIKGSQQQPTIIVKFTLNQESLSDVRVNRPDMFGEKYKPFKGDYVIALNNPFSATADNSI